MKRRPKDSRAKDSGAASMAADSEAVLQIKVWLIGLIPVNQALICSTASAAASVAAAALSSALRRFGGRRIRAGYRFPRPLSRPPHTS